MELMMKYVRMLIEKESPEQFGYDRIKFNLAESSVIRGLLLKEDSNVFKKMHFIDGCIQSDAYLYLGQRTEIRWEGFWLFVFRAP